MEAPLPEPVLKERKRSGRNHGYESIDGKFEEREHVKRGDASEPTPPSAYYISLRVESCHGILTSRRLFTGTPRNEFLGPRRYSLHSGAE